MFTFACGSVEGLTLAQKRETIKALRESIKADLVHKRMLKASNSSAKALEREAKAAERAAKKAERIAKLEAKLANLKNPVGTKAVKANRKAGAVKVFNPQEIAEANAIAARLKAKKAA